MVMHLLSVLVLASIYIPAVVCRGAHVCVICSCMGIVSYLCIVVFVTIDFILIFGVVAPLSAIFQLYHGDQLQRWKKQEYQERTTDHGQATGKLYDLRLRVECTFFLTKQGANPRRMSCQVIQLPNSLIHQGPLCLQGWGLMSYLCYLYLVTYSGVQYIFTISVAGVVVVIVWQLDLQLPVQSVYITTKVVSSNPVHREMYSKQHYVIKFVSDMRQVVGFLRILRFPPPIKLTATIQLKYC